MMFYSPAGLLLLLAIPGVIVLYMLKQRFDETEVSSTYLWRQALRDVEASIPWQRIKKNILMMLQIICVMLLAFALSKPYVRVSGVEPDSILIAIDTSMSMQSTDVAPSRFEAARKKARSITENLRPGTRITLVEMGAYPVILENLSADRNRITDAVDGISATYCVSDLEASASLIQSVMKTCPGIKVFILGDKKVGIYGRDIQQFMFGCDGPNHAITHQSYLRTSDAITVLTRVESTERDISITASMYVDGGIYDSREIRLDSSGKTDIYWDGIPLSAEVVECRIESGDCLMPDNTAWTVVSAEKDSKVLLATERNMFLERALSLVPGIEVYRALPRDVDVVPGGYDLYVFDGIIPDVLPEGHVLLVNPPENDLFKAFSLSEYLTARAMEHRLTLNIRAYTFGVGLSQVFELPLWGEAVFACDDGPIAFAGKYEGRGVVVVGFDIHDTDMALKPAFPIFITDTVNWLLPRGAAVSDSLLTGQAIEFNLKPSATEAMVISPSGIETRLAPPFPPGMFEGAREPGIYTLVQKTPDGEEKGLAAVNVPAGEEAGIYGRGAGEEPVNEYPEQGRAVSLGTGLQGIIVLLLMAFLVIEWWVYANVV